MAASNDSAIDLEDPFNELETLLEEIRTPRNGRKRRAGNAGDQGAAGPSAPKRPAQPTAAETELSNVRANFKCVVCGEYEALGGYGAECGNGHRVCAKCFAELQRDKIVDDDYTIDDEQGNAMVLHRTKLHHGSSRCVVCSNDSDLVRFQERAPSDFYRRLEGTLRFECSNIGCTFIGTMASLCVHARHCLNQVLQCSIKYCMHKMPIKMREFEEHLRHTHRKQYNETVIGANGAIKLSLIVQRMGNLPVPVVSELGWAAMVLHQGHRYLIQALLEDDVLAATVTAMDLENEMTYAKVKFFHPERKSISRKIRIQEAVRANSSAAIGDLLSDEFALTAPATETTDVLRALSYPAVHNGKDHFAIGLGVKLLPNPATAPAIDYVLAKQRKYEGLPMKVVAYTRDRKIIINS